MQPAAFLAGGFNGVLASTNPLQTTHAWCVGGLGLMTQVKVDLSAYAGMAIKVRWLESDDTVLKLVGWYVDDVTVGTTGVCKNLLFSDGFESGTLPGAWSGTVP